MKIYVVQVMEDKTSTDILAEQENAKVVIAHKMHMDADELDVEFIDSRFIYALGFYPDANILSI